MIFQIKSGEKTYRLDDLLPFYRQDKEFIKAFNEAEKDCNFNCTTAYFDNAEVSVIYQDRMIVTMNEDCDEDSNMHKEPAEQNAASDL